MDRDALAVVPEAAPQATTPIRGIRRGSFRALRSQPFRRYFAGQVVSASGTFLQQTAIGWLVLKLTGSAKHYQFTRLQPYFNPGPLPSGPPPIWLGGVGTKMWHLAGERADGIVTHPTNRDPSYVQSGCLPTLHDGERSAGRASGSTRVIVGPSLITGRNETAVLAERDRQRQLLAFLYSTPAYRPTLDRYGLGHITERLHQLSLDQQWSDLASVLTDKVINQLVPCFPYDQLAEVLIDRYGAWADGIRLSITADATDDEQLGRLIAALQAHPGPPNGSH